MPKFSANLTLLYGEHGFPERFAAAAAAGFRAVECQFPYACPKEQLAEQLRRHDLQMVLHNLPAGDWARGERGIAVLAARTGEFQDGVGQAIEYARALGCPQLNCLAGIRPPSVAPEQARETLITNLRFAADALRAAGMRLLVEAINTYDIPGFAVSSTQHALDLLAATGRDNVFLQFDMYHMQRMGEDLAATLEKHLGRIAHIQIADDPGRHEPGTGGMAFDRLLPLIDSLGYEGWVGCEYVPRTTTDAGLAWRDAYSR